jgi:hypothetical protein
MTIAQFITRISEAYNYDRKKVKLLFKSQILNKHPEASLTFFGVGGGDQIYVLNYSRSNMYESQLTRLKEFQQQGALKA